MDSDMPRLPTIVNALLRCRRDDDRAREVFELVNPEHGIWVRELPEDLDAICADLSTIRPLLLALAEGGEDHTLHIAVAFTEFGPIIIPPRLAELAGSCGFAIECFLACDDGTLPAGVDVRVGTRKSGPPFHN